MNNHWRLNAIVPPPNWGNSGIGPVKEAKAMNDKRDMDFGGALAQLRAGEKVQRIGWNGKGMWLILVDGTRAVQPREGTPYAKAGIEVVNIKPHIDMFTADGEMQPGWLASQTDMLATDWQIV